MASRVEKCADEDKYCRAYGYDWHHDADEMDVAELREACGVAEELRHGEHGQAGLEEAFRSTDVAHNLGQESLLLLRDKSIHQLLPEDAAQEKVCRISDSVSDKDVEEAGPEAEDETDQRVERGARKGCDDDR